MNICIAESQPQQHVQSQAQEPDESQQLATHLEYLSIKSSLTPGERSFILGATHALKDQLAREGSTAGRSRLTQKELLTEAERVLLRSAGGMSLLERLRRDAQLREEMFSLLREFADMVDVQEQLAAPQAQATPAPRTRA